MFRQQIFGRYCAPLLLIVTTALVATPALAAKTWKFAYTATSEKNTQNGPTVQRFEKDSVAYVHADEGGGIVRCFAILQWDVNNIDKQLGASGDCVLVDSNINTASGIYVYNGTASTPWVNSKDRTQCLTKEGCGTTLPNFWRVDEATGYIEFCGTPPLTGIMYCFRKMLP